MKNLLKILTIHKFNIGLLVFLGIIIVGTINKLGYYPVLIVNHQIITEQKINLNRKAALTYYKNYLDFLNKNSLVQTSTPNTFSKDEIEIIILNKLVEQALIHEEIKKRLGKNLNNLIEEKIKDYLTSKVEEAAKIIYNLDKEDFKNEILVPQAERDLLTGRLFLENKNIKEWLVDAKKNAKIKIFNPKFKWIDGEIKLND